MIRASISTSLGLAALVLVTASALAPKARAQVPISLTSNPYTQNFDSLGSTGTSSTLPAGWAVSETGAAANATYAADDGASATGDTYSFGASGSSDRALGTVRSTVLGATFGAAFKNDTGATINSLAVSYHGEQWRLGATGRADQLDFQYSLDATSLTTGTWQDVNALDFASPSSSGAVGARDGNAADSRTQVAFTATQTTNLWTVIGLAIPAGQTFWIRWVDADATGDDDGLAIDDFSLTPSNELGTGLALRRSLAIAGSYALTGNAIVDCTTPWPCTAGNNNTSFDYVDADSDSTTSGSSAATLTLPAGAIPRVSYLLVTMSGTERYTGGPVIFTRWSDSYRTSNVSARFKPPGASDYTTLKPDYVKNEALGTTYQAIYDVSSMVTSAGEFWVADPTKYPSTSDYNAAGNWVLIVIYDLPGAPTQRVNIYDGTRSCNNASFQVGVSGFTTPSTGIVQGQLSIMAADGSSKSGADAGDAVTLNTTPLSNALNPVTNIGNNTVSDVTGVAIPRVPTNYSGDGTNPAPIHPTYFQVADELLDIDTFDVDGAFSNNATSGTVTFACGNDGVLWHGLVLAFDIKAPVLNVVKSASVAGPVQSGDTFTYTMTVTNPSATSPENAQQAMLTDTLPAGLVPSGGDFTVAYNGGAASALTVAADADAGEVVDGVVTVRLGDLALGASATVTVGVQVSNPVSVSSFDNEATVTYHGMNDLTRVTKTSNQVTLQTITDAQCSPQDQSCDEEVVYLVAHDATGAAVGTARCVSDGSASSCDTEADPNAPAGAAPLLKIYPALWCPGVTP